MIGHQKLFFLAFVMIIALIIVWNVLAYLRHDNYGNTIVSLPQPTVIMTVPVISLVPDNRIDAGVFLRKMKNYRRVSGCKDSAWEQRPTWVPLPLREKPYKALVWSAPSFGSTHNLSDLVEYPPRFEGYFSRLKTMLKWDLPQGHFPRDFFQQPRFDCERKLYLHYNYTDFDESDVIYFAYPYYGTNSHKVDPDMLPPRLSHHIWVLSFSGESMDFYPAIGQPSFLSLMNYTFGYHRGFFTGKTTPYVPEAHELYEKLKKPDEADRLLLNETAPVAMFVSHCVQERQEFYHNLKQFIGVDNYGSCEQSKRMPDGWEMISRPQAKRRVLAHYPFTIAIENSRCFDYVTEKVYDALMAGSIPLYLGASNIEDYVPDKSIIRVDLFSSPKELAAYLHQLLESKEELKSYQEWRRYAVPERLKRLHKEVTLCGLFSFFE